MQKDPLTFEEWYDINDSDLSCIAAETGADRDGDFNSEDFAEEQYFKYLEGAENA